MNNLSYLLALMHGNMKANMANKKQTFYWSIFMFLQNLMFFIMWIIFFDNVSEIKGWALPDVSRMYGIVGGAVGLTLFLFNGVRSIARHIDEGTLDMHISRPRSVLPTLLCSDSAPASIGDMCFALLLLLTLGNMGWQEFPLFFALIILSMIIFMSSTVIIYSLAFWLKGNTRFSDQMFEMLIIASVGVIHAQPFAVRVIAFTVLPAGFISYLPVEIIRNFDWWTMSAMTAAALFYAAIAILVFNAGLRRYVQAKV